MTHVPIDCHRKCFRCLTLHESHGGVPDDLVPGLVRDCDECGYRCRVGIARPLGIAYVRPSQGLTKDIIDRIQEALRGAVGRILLVARDPEGGLHDIHIEDVDYDVSNHTRSLIIVDLVNTENTGVMVEDLDLPREAVEEIRPIHRDVEIGGVKARLIVYPEPVLDSEGRVRGLSASPAVVARLDVQVGREPPRELLSLIEGLAFKETGKLYEEIYTALRDLADQLREKLQSTRVGS